MKNERCDAIKQLTSLPSYFTHRNRPDYSTFHQTLTRYRYRIHITSTPDIAFGFYFLYHIMSYAIIVTFSSQFQLECKVARPVYNAKMAMRPARPAPARRAEDLSAAPVD
jgi:hypothetical protein